VNFSVAPVKRSRPSTISRERRKQYPVCLGLDDEDSAPMRADAEKALTFVRSFG
jgi:hypothetical protein